MAWAGDPRRRSRPTRRGPQRPQFIYWPLGLFAVLAAAVLHPAAIAGLGYVGGAGTFDGVFLAGIIAVLVAILL